MSGIDLIRVQEALPEGISDPDILEWAAAENRVLITCDKKTMIGFAHKRRTEGGQLPGLIVLPQSLPVGLAIQQIRMIAECVSEQEMQERVIIFLPV